MMFWLIIILGGFLWLSAIIAVVFACMRSSQLSRLEEKNPKPFHFEMPDSFGSRLAVRCLYSAAERDAGRL